MLFQTQLGKFCNGSSRGLSLLQRATRVALHRNGWEERARIFTGEIQMFSKNYIK